MRAMPGKTLYDKIWDAHVVAEQDGEAILYIDLHLIHEVTTPQAFAGLRAANRPVRRPDRSTGICCRACTPSWRRAASPPPRGCAG